MKQRYAVAALIAVLMLTGCVMKSDYLARVADIEGLQKTKASLEEKNQATEKALAEQQKKNEELTKQKEDLEKQKAELEKQRAGLFAENAMIKSTLETKKELLSREVVDLKNKQIENNGRIKALEEELVARNNQIAGLNAQMAQVSQEKERALVSARNTYDSLVSELKQEIKQGEIQITQLKDKLTVNMVEKILFDSGSAVIKKNGTKVLDRVADILKGLSKQQIKVEGHTDNVPIGPGLAEKFPTNWELSTARATTVVRYLQGRGVNPNALSAEGYADFRPVSSNDTDEGKAKNRRIEIVLIPMDVAK